MTQYAMQIIDETHQLIKNYEVTPEHPIRQIVPEGRTQFIITDTVLFNEAVAAYNKYTTDAKYYWDGETLTWDTPPENQG